MLPYILYHARWQLSAIVMLPFMMIFQLMGIPLWLNLPLGQFIGALIFWVVDSKLFEFKARFEKKIK